MFLNLATILYFSFCAVNKIQNNNYILANDKQLTDLDEIRNTGMDERVNKMTDIIDGGEINIDLLTNINENFYKKRVLETLQDDKISLIEKMNVLNRYLLYVHTEPPVNLFAGGLLDDWDFELK
tara:strand:- start:356 stop:727 length:372 start_codon:yes stop_codon:yes gene_type:complete